MTKWWRCQECGTDTMFELDGHFVQCNSCGLVEVYRFRFWKWLSCVYK